MIVRQELSDQCITLKHTNGQIVNYSIERAIAIYNMQPPGLESLKQQSAHLAVHKEISDQLDDLDPEMLNITFDINNNRFTGLEIFFQKSRRNFAVGST